MKELTAKEQAEICLRQFAEEDFAYCFNPAEFENFCNQLLKEQREICAEVSLKHHIERSTEDPAARIITPDIVKDEIKNCKRPEFV